MINWLEPSQDNFYFKEEVVNIKQCLIAGISGINISCLIEDLLHVGHSPLYFVVKLCGKLREATLQIQIHYSHYFFLLLSKSSHQLPLHPSFHPSVHHHPVFASSLNLLHSILTLENMHSIRIFPQTGLVIFSDYFYPYPKPPKAPNFLSPHLPRTEFKE